MKDLASSLNIPGYRIVRELGRGGMATVFLAVQESFGRDVALKVMSSSLAQDQSFSERFLREAKIVAQLIHPNIVTVYDVGLADGHHYLSMEYVPGEDLKRVGNKLSLARRCDVIKQVAQALEFARVKGYIHRDVKPENIRLQAESERVVLMDFGIARASDLHSGMTQTGTAVGTPHYMSPEQARGKSVDHRSDLYSLGIVFYWLLTGRVPYSADSAVAVGIKHITEPVPRLPGHLKMLQPILERLLAKQPDQRYQTAAELVSALADFTVESLHEAELEAGWGDALETKQHKDLVRRKPVKVPELKISAEREDDHDPVTVITSASGWWPWLLGITVALAVVVAVYWQQVQVSGDSPVQRWLEKQGLTDSGPAEAVPTPTDAAPVAADADSRPAAGNEAESIAGPTAEPAGPLPEGPATVAGPTPLELWDQQQAEWLRLEQQLQPSLASWQDILPQLAAQWQALPVALVGSDREAANSWINAQQARLFELLQGHLGASREQKDRQQVAQWIALAEQHLPAQIPTDPLLDGPWKASKSWLAEQSIIADLLRQAEAYLQGGELSESAESEILGGYRQVLELDRNNADALAGLQAISERYHTLAREQWRLGHVAAAERFLARGEQVLPESPLWPPLKTDLQAMTQRRQSLSQKLDDVDRLHGQGKWVSLSGDDNAAATLRTILREAAKAPPLEDILARAKQKQQALSQEVSERILLLADGKAFAEARELLIQAESLLPASNRLQVAAQYLREAEDAAMPKIAQLRIGADPTQMAPAGDGPVSFRASRSIAIQFAYQNFVADTSLVQAVLMDATESKDIAQVPVVVNGREGVKQFKIERPVEGFGQGRYWVKLVLEGKALARESFTIE